jgi:hypothetical protein
MTGERWYKKYDFSFIFSSTWDHEGYEFVCDEEDSCWTFIEDTEEVCDIDWNCYYPEEALRIYFEGDKENWNHGQDFNWDDWRANFDMT